MRGYLGISNRYEKDLPLTLPRRTPHRYVWSPTRQSKFRTPFRYRDDLKDFRSPSDDLKDFRSPSDDLKDFRSPSDDLKDFRSPSDDLKDFRSPSDDHQDLYPWII